eukprot:Hpha_TRINITY_DN856_c0_g1::TRINITY_DN856_c0_g1_i1::g.195000::m.195000
MVCDTPSKGSLESGSGSIGNTTSGAAWDSNWASPHPAATAPGPRLSGMAARSLCAAGLRPGGAALKALKKKLFYRDPTTNTAPAPAPPVRGGLGLFECPPICTDPA